VNSAPRGTPIRSPARGNGSRGAGSSPAITASAAAHSATVRARGPRESREKESGNAPARGTRRAVGLKPTTPLSEAGIRTEPPVSDPIAMSLVPCPTETPAPEDEPPGMRSGSAALPGVP
jgi:hypothetical protein